MLVHMTFKDKSFFYRHHLISIASWAKLNPDYNILMYDDHDLHQYLTYDDTVLQVGMWVVVFVWVVLWFQYKFCVLCLQLTRWSCRLLAV